MRRSLCLLALTLGSPALAASANAAETAQVLFGLFYIVLAATLGALILGRLGLPSVVGQVLAGLLIGPSVLGLAELSSVNRALAELGAVFLLFMVGLETRYGALLKVGKEALLVAILGITFPMILGYAFGAFRGQDTISALFVGTALVATSVGITAKVLSELGVLSRRYAQVILGAAVIDDILGLTILAVVSGLRDQGLNLGALGFTLALSVGFVVLVLLIGVPLMRALARHVHRWRVAPYFPLAVAAGLGLAALSQSAGLAPIIGAFLAGMVLAEVKDEAQFEGQVHSLEAFLAPVFFVVVGMQLDVSVLANPAVLAGGLILSVLAILGKYVGGLLGALPLGRRDASIVGLGMVPRGEVGLIVASVGLSLGIVTNTVYAEVLLMVLLTTILPPVALRWLIARDATPAATAA